MSDALPPGTSGQISWIAPGKPSPGKRENCLSKKFLYLILVSLFDIYRYEILIVDISTLLKNINININMVIFENMGIDKLILKNIDIDKKNMRKY